MLWQIHGLGPHSVLHRNNICYEMDVVKSCVTHREQVGTSFEGSEIRLRPDSTYGAAGSLLRRPAQKLQIPKIRYLPRRKLENISSVRSGEGTYTFIILPWLCMGIKVLS